MATPIKRIFKTYTPEEQATRDLYGNIIENPTQGTSYPVNQRQTEVFESPTSKEAIARLKTQSLESSLGDTNMAEATGISLAAEQEKAVQEALKRQKAEEEALMKAYQQSSQGIYDTSKTAAASALTGSRSDIESLYRTGYQDLQNLIGRESEAAIKESLRPIEGKLAAQGLLGGPSGALNEALAGASERVRNAGLAKLEDYLGQKTGALSNLYGTQGTQLAGLEQAYGTQSQGLQATALENALGLSGKATDIANQYGMAGLEAALGTNKLTLEQAGQKDLLAEQAALNAEAAAAAAATKAQELKTAQNNWDRQFQNLRDQYYEAYRKQGWMLEAARTMAETEALRAVGPRPT